MDWTSVTKVLAEARSIVLITHIHADGDTLGSAAALAGFLVSQGKLAMVVTEEPLPQKLSFLGRMTTAPFYLADDFDKEFDVAVAIDVSDDKRLGKRVDLISRAKSSVRIDHHATGNDFADVNICNPKWAATAEGIFELITSMGCRWELTGDELYDNMLKSVAKCIYTALVTDTGCFAYANVTAVTHMTASIAMLTAGEDLSWIYRDIFETKTRSSVALMARAWAKIEFLRDGRISYLYLSKNDYDETGATDEDGEGLSSMLRAIEGVHVGVLVRDGSHEGEIRISLRSDELCDVSRCASFFGGGGHARAAGITVTFDSESSINDSLNGLDDLKARLIDTLDAEIVERINNGVK